MPRACSFEVFPPKYCLLWVGVIVVVSAPRSGKTLPLPRLITPLALPAELVRELDFAEEMQLVKVHPLS